MLNNINEFWQTNIVCPQCHGNVKIFYPSILCEKCNNTYSIINGVPCFINKNLSDHQKSELSYWEIIVSREKDFNQKEECYKWAMRWINNRTINETTKILCIGGAILDDLPHVKSNFKFNLDHLAHQYIKIFPEIINANVKHIAVKSEQLPFENEYADIVYSRNSLDHVNNPIKTLLEINRVLKSEGKFFLSVFYNSYFITSHETTSIDDEFLENHIKNLFDIEWIQICPPESEGVRQPLEFSLPENRKLGWLYAVLRKKMTYIPYNEKILEEYDSLISNFHSAIYYQMKKEFLKASKYFQKVINSKPLLHSDENRILYSKIWYLALENRKAFKNFFSQFKLTCKDPFWWKIVIDSSRSFMKRQLKKAINTSFQLSKEKKYLEWYISIKEFHSLNKILHQIKEKFYKYFPFFANHLKSMYFVLERKKLIYYIKTRFDLFFEKYK